MTNILGYSFDGPHSINANFNVVAGVYVITTANNAVVDVGETDNLKERIPNHDRKPCWARNSGTWLYFLKETRPTTRLAIEKSIRDRYNPACGVK